MMMLALKSLGNGNNMNPLVDICKCAPTAKGQIPAATSAADPEDEPPV